VVAVSLCICTVNRPAELARALTSVTSGPATPAEIIVSDDSKDPGVTREVVTEFPGVRYERGPRQGVGANRNFCTRVSTQRSVTFMDDDAVAPSTHLATIEDIIGRRPRAVVSGRIVNHFTDGTTEAQSPGSADFLGFATRPWGAGHGNMIEMNATVFPTELFERASFDTKLRYGYEEIDISRQAVDLGYVVAFDPRLWVDHYPSGRSDDHHAFVDAARLYATFHHYRSRERRLDKAAAYAAVAPVHHLLAAAKSPPRGRALKSAASDVVAAARLCVSP